MSWKGSGGGKLGPQSWSGDDWGGGGAKGSGWGKDKGWEKGGGKGYNADPWATGGKGKGGKDDWGKGGKDKGGYGAWGKEGGGKGGWGKDKGKHKGWGGDKGWGKDAGKGGGGDWMHEQSAYVKTWNEERGFGFVTVATGEDIYVHRTTLTDGDGLTLNAEVWVEAQWDWAKSKWASTRCSGATPKGGGKGGGGKGKDVFHAKGPTPAKGGKGKGKRGSDWMNGQSAWVKAWTEERGFGFVSTAQNEDIYVHRTTLADGSMLEVQAEVTVDAVWNWEKNKWHATRLTGAGGDAPKTAGVDQPITMGPQGGTVKAWQAKGGYGFLVPDNGGPDVFVHGTALQNGATALTVGEAVTFDLQMDEKTGKYLAVTCTPSDGTPPEAGDFGPAPKGKKEKAEPYNPFEGSAEAELEAELSALA